MDGKRDTVILDRTGIVKEQPIYDEYHFDEMNSKIAEIVMKERSQINQEERSKNMQFQLGGERISLKL